MLHMCYLSGYFNGFWPCLFRCLAVGRFCVLEPYCIRCSGTWKVLNSWGDTEQQHGKSRTGQNRGNRPFVWRLIDPLRYVYDVYIYIYLCIFLNKYANTSRCTFICKWMCVQYTQMYTHIYIYIHKCMQMFNESALISLFPMPLKKSSFP